jgi:cell fate (sporulation/competence/biofilm development) regulator YmcA (YheA/YmcA/DUF963 family)
MVLTSIVALRILNLIRKQKKVDEALSACLKKSCLLLTYHKDEALSQEESRGNSMTKSMDSQQWPEEVETEEVLLWL